MINYIQEGLGPEFEPVLLHIVARIDTFAEKLSLPYLKLIFQKYEGRLDRSPYDLSHNTTNLVN